MGGDRTPASATALANAAKDWIDAYVDVELECPPDDSDSWPEDVERLLKWRDLCEDRYKNLIQRVIKYGIEDDL